MFDKIFFIMPPSRYVRFPLSSSTSYRCSLSPRLRSVAALPVA